MDNNQIRTYLQNLGSDWVVWKKNYTSWLVTLVEFRSAKSALPGRC